jgi:hypothetical protein
MFVIVFDLVDGLLKATCMNFMRLVGIVLSSIRA